MIPKLKNLATHFLCKVLSNFHIILFAWTPMDFVEIHKELENFIFQIFLKRKKKKKRLKPTSQTLENLFIPTE